MITFNKMIVSGLLVLGSQLAFAQAAPDTYVTPSSPANQESTAPAVTTSQDPFVQKRDADKAAKQHYKDEKDTAKQEFKDAKKANRQERNNALKDNKAEDPTYQPSGK